MGDTSHKIGAVLVVGGGIGGIQAALELADRGLMVHLVERQPFIGGRMAQLDKTFPTNDCAMCMISPKLVAVSRHPNIEIITQAEVEEVSGRPGAYEVTLRVRERFVDPGKCTGCGDCVDVCPVSVRSEFNAGLSQRTAIHRPSAQSTPPAFALDRRGISPCTASCPAGVNAHGYVALAAKGLLAEALALEREQNPLPAICGRVCHHPCEPACARGGAGDPLAIMKLKRFLADNEAGGGGAKPAPFKVVHGERIAVVGSGPAGLACAWRLARMGYPVTVFEAADRPGGLLASAIPEYRLPRGVLEAELDRIFAHGIELKTSTRIGAPGMGVGDLLGRGFKAIFLAAGAVNSITLGIEGEDLPGVIDALNYLRMQNLGGGAPFAKNVAVIGGGNAAIDSARTALRLGAGNVTVYYRRSRQEMPAIPFEVEAAIGEGVEFRFNAAPVSIAAASGRASGVRFVRTAPGSKDGSGRHEPVPIPGSGFAVPADLVITAAGQAPDRGAFGPELAERLGAMDAAACETSMPGVFAGGDFVYGPQTVVGAIASGNRAADAIDRYLRGSDPAARAAPIFPEYRPDVSKIKAAARVPSPIAAPGAARGSFGETETGYDAASAAREAGRCLNCAVCCECGRCVSACKAGAIKTGVSLERRKKVDVGAAVLAAGFDIFDPSGLSEYGFGRHADVVTGIQFERMLSSSGPTGGKLARPSDGREPKKIAFIQCVGSRDRRARRYCSSFCCMQAAKEATAASEHHPGVECTIFYSDLRAFGKGFEIYAEQAAARGVRFVRAQPSTVRADGSGGALVLSIAAPDGAGRAEEAFDLVVLSAAAVPPAGFCGLLSKFGVEPDDEGFFACSGHDPIPVVSAGMCTGPRDINETVTQATAAAARVAAYLAGAARVASRVSRERPPQRDVSGEETAMGVFICRCGMNIAGTVDVEEVAGRASMLPGVKHAGIFRYACSPDAQREIVSAIREKGLNRVVVASCTPRTHEPVFQDMMADAGLNPYLFEMANIREHCSWVHRDRPAEATEKAAELVAMAAAKAARLRPLAAGEVEVFRKAVVLGGGAAGLASALSLKGQGIDVTVVERSGDPGGNALRSAYARDRAEAMVSAAASAGIEIRTGASLRSFCGGPGRFELELSDGSAIRAGAVIVATGALPHRPEGFLYGKDPRVMTQLELEGRGYEGVGGTVAMIQCVGSRDAAHRYCSRVCCVQAARNAKAVLGKTPGARVLIIYDQMVTPGLDERFYTEAREAGAIFARRDPGSAPEVKEGDGGKLEVSWRDAILGCEETVPADFVVLSAGIGADPANQALAGTLKVPVMEDGFLLEAHAKLRPVDFSSTGIFVAGMVHAPKGFNESVEQGVAAAGRAGVMLSGGRIRLGAMVVKADRERCAACLTCVRLCPYGAASLAADGFVSIDESKCEGCGMCAAACPGKVLELGRFRDDQIIGMLDGLRDARAGGRR